VVEHHRVLRIEQHWLAEHPECRAAHRPELTRRRDPVLLNKHSVAQ
jgi:hypothetical protein